MSRCFLFAASLLLTGIAISATAGPPEWRYARAGGDTSLDAAATMASWATVPAPRLFSFRAVQL